MRYHEDRVLLSASDLMRFQACTHATALDLRYLQGNAGLTPCEDSAEAALLQAKGDAHEGAFLARLRGEGLEVAEVETSGVAFEAARDATRRALTAGPAFIYQAALANERWGGYADFLERVDRPSRLGPFSYEVIDTKLKRSPDPKHLLQLALYAELLAQEQGVRPEHVHIVLGDDSRRTFRVADYAAYATRLRARLERFVAEPWPTRPEPVPACGLCRWRLHCEAAWDQSSSLCLVAGIMRGQRRKLEAAGVMSLPDLAQGKEAVPKLAKETLAKLRTQARLQHARRRGGQPSFELKSIEPGRGLSRLPRPDPGDLFFDIEGDPYVEGRLEYLFGVYGEAEGEPRFDAIWAHDRAAERQAVGEILQRFRTHLHKHPKAHIYHYGSYEPTTLKRLASHHAVGETVLDQLLREERFVDLYRVVMQGLYASEAGYSIKDLEVFYMPGRESAVASGMESVIAYERWCETGDPAILEQIRAYNETDCRSTKGLRDWLASQVRPKDLGWFEPAVAKASAAADAAGEDPVEVERAALMARLAAARARLGDSLADLLLELCSFHRREDKPQWWTMFDRAERDSEDLIDDLDSLGGLVAIKPAESVKRSKVRRYRYPSQESKLREGSRARTRDGLAPVSIAWIDPEQSLIDVKFGPKAGDPPQRLDLVPDGPIKNEVLRLAVNRVVNDLIAGGNCYPGLERLLRRQLPKLAGWSVGAELVPGSTEVVAGTIEAVAALDGSHLPVQGPPGTGKTYTSSHAILALLGEGKRVGVASNSHKAIDNLLRAVADRAREEGFSLQAVKKIASEDGAIEDPLIETTGDNEDDRLFDYPLVGGTAWLFARADHDQAFDYLFVDEAGQVALANLIAMGSAARNIVLVGDPMQLAQPIQGAHPGDTGLSGLEYALQGHATVPPEQGIFLPVSRRMHPSICRYISDLVYEGRLASSPETARQRIEAQRSDLALPAAGIRFVEVSHEGNSQSSEEEAAAIAKVHAALLGARFTDQQGRARQMTLDDILVVSPYNAQVNLLKRVLGAGARVGTIDKFQGQEAPACLISMATSSGDEMPRDISFLFSVNRLNVAVSRAQALAIVFASPRLLDVACGTIEEMKLVNALCALHDYQTPPSG